MTFFFDRNVGSKLPTALRLLGLDVAWHDEQGFTPATSDEEWLREAGLHAWTVVTHDTRLVRNLNEREALVAAGVGCFVISGGSADRWSKVRARAAAWPRILSIVANEPIPYVWRHLPSGRWIRDYPD